MLSVAIVSKNEEKTIGLCIESVRNIADEIIVVDSGSTDRTVEIAKELGAKVFFREWTDYVDQVNYTLNLCSGEWILVLDADEAVDEKLSRSIKEAIENREYDCYKLKRRTYYLGKFLSFTEKRIRLFRKDKAFYKGFVHERVVCSGRVGEIEGYINHYSYDGLKQHILKALGYAEKIGRYNCEKGMGVSLLNLIFNPVCTFLKFYIFKGCIKDGPRGFIYSSIMAFYTFMKYAFLLENHLRKRMGKELWKK